MMLNPKSIELYSKILCPPGNGVFTVNTAKERKEKLHQEIYQSIENIEEKWSESLTSFSEKSVKVLGVCSDTGGGILRGANWGPLFVRLAMMDAPGKVHYEDIGDIRVIPHFHHDKYLNNETIKSCQKALYGKECDLPVSSLSLCEAFCDDFFNNYPNQKLFSIGGDHSVSYPLVKSFLKAKKKQGKKIGLIHFDAHTDLLVDRLGVDICFGSWVTHILDYLDEPSLCYQFGIRSSAKDKSHWESKFGIQQFWTHEIQEKGISFFIEHTINDLKSKNVDELYISFDIDAIDSKFASATGTPEKDGLLPHECHLIIEALGNEFPVTGADLVEVAPFIKSENQGHDQTLEVSGALGKLLLSYLSKS